MLSLPVRHNESLKSQFALQDIVQELRVLTAVRVVDLVVRTHDRADTCAHSVRKGPHVKFMQRRIIDIRGDGVGYVPSVTCRFTDLAEVFLMTVISNRPPMRFYTAFGSITNIGMRKIGVT
jgi:hypothetical protein